MKTQITLTEEDRLVVKLRREQARLAKTGKAHHKAAAAVLRALLPKATVEAKKASRTITIGTKRNGITASFTTAKNGSVYQVPTAAALSAAIANKTPESSIVQAIAKALPFDVSSLALARLLATEIFSGLWHEFDLNNKAERELAIVGAQARKLPPGVLP